MKSCAIYYGIVFPLLMLLAMPGFGQVTITLTATAGTCPANGSITVITSGTVGSLLYSIKKSTAPAYSPEQTSNVFSNYGSGIYTVKVHDANGETVSSPVTLTNAAYTTMTIGNSTIANAVITACDPDGSLDMDIAGGRPPFTYHLSGGPTTKPDVITSIRNVKYNQLATGIYRIDVTDACSNIIGKTNLNVVSQYNLNGIVLGSVDGMGGAVQFGGNCADTIMFSTNNILLKDINGVVLFQRDVKHMPANYPVDVRVEYPSGSGIYTDWQNVFTKFTLPNYLPANNQYRVQMRHPCDLSNIVTSPAYDIAYPYQSRSGFCAPSVTRTTKNYFCGPVDILITNKANSAITRTYTWDGSGASYTLDLTGLAAGTYAVSITTAGQTYNTMDVTTAAQTGINMTATFNYLSTSGCDFFTGGIRSYRTNFPTDNTIPITYTIVSGPATRPPVTGLQPIDPIWNDLPGGSYQVRVDYGDCRTETRTVPIDLPFKGFAADDLTYIPGSSCGKYKITGLGWFLGKDSLVSTSTTQTYAARLFTAAGVAITGSGVTATAINNNPFTLNYEVGPGTYRVKLVNQLHSELVCYYLEKVITIPPYTPVQVDIAKSGGVACGSGFGDVHVEAVGGTLHIEPGGGSRRTLVYRIKPTGTSDDNFTPYQLSPDFPNKPVGIYTAQVFDSCNYTTTQDIEMVARATSSSIDVTGATINGGIGNVCERNAVSLKLNIIGSATGVNWTAPDNTVSSSNNFVISNFTTANEGKYFVSYTSGGCSRQDSVSLLLTPAPVYTFDADSTICQGQQVDLTAEVSNPSVNSSIRFFLDPVATREMPVTAVSPVASTSYFSQSTDSITGCKSTIGQIRITVNHPPLIGTFAPPPPACDQNSLLLTEPEITESGSPVTSHGWLLNDMPFDEHTMLTMADNGKQLRYIAESACGTSTTTTTIIAINPKPVFAFNDPDTIISPQKADLTTLTLASGDTTGLTLTYFTDAYTPMSPGEIDAAEDGTYHIVGTTPDGCSDTSTVTVTIVEVPLPVGLVYFRVIHSNGNALLKWRTAYEQNSDHFDVESSTDGQTFNKLGAVASAGNSSMPLDYEYVDANIERYNADKIYYRLRQVDRDGKFEYGKIVSITWRSNSNEKIITAYPLPFTTYLTIDVSAIGINNRQPIFIHIADMTGRMVYQRELTINNGQKTITLTDLSALSAGTYTMKINNDKIIKTIKIIKE